VYVHDPRTSVPHVILIECKHWGSNLPQDAVHGFRTVMADCGANTGIIVGSTGFQSGAVEAVAYTNIEFRTWKSLQRAFGKHLRGDSGRRVALARRRGGVSAID